MSDDRNQERRPAGLRKGLTSYGDTAFSLFLRKAFVKGAGYTDDALVRSGIAVAGADFIQKPFRPHALTEKVHSVLRRNPNP